MWASIPLFSYCFLTTLLTFALCLTGAGMVRPRGIIRRVVQASDSASEASIPLREPVAAVRPVPVYLGHGVCALAAQRLRALAGSVLAGFNLAAGLI